MVEQPADRVAREHTLIRFPRTRIFDEITIYQADLRVPLKCFAHYCQKIFMNVVVAVDADDKFSARHSNPNVRRMRWAPISRQKFRANEVISRKSFVQRYGLTAFVGRSVINNDNLVLVMRKALVETTIYGAADVTLLIVACNYHADLYRPST